MITNENESNAPGNRVSKNPMFHRNGNTQERAALMNAQSLGKLAGFIGLDKSVDRTAAFKLQDLRKSAIAFVKSFCKFNIHD